MQQSTIRQIIRAATLSLLVLATTSGIAGSPLAAAGPVPSLPDPPPTPTPTPVPPLPIPGAPS